LATAAFRLRKSGFEVRNATDGKQALETAIEWLPDIVFMDIQMPVMDGVEACQRMKAEPALAKIPVVLMSASVESLPNRQEAAWADASLPKPYDPAKLFELIKKLLPEASHV